MKHVKNLLVILALMCIDLPVTLIGLIVVPLALLFCNPASEHLPRWAWLWDNDETGINGDGDATGGWRGPEHANGRERTFWWRYAWLALRNPANNWSYFVLGWKTTANTRYKIWGDPLTSNRDPGRPGWLYCEAYESGAMRPCYYIVARWSRTRCLRIYLGWKNKGFDRDGSRTQFVWVINPFMTFKE